jgi:hypothetical protein
MRHLMDDSKLRALLSDIMRGRTYRETGVVAHAEKDKH